MSSNINYEHPDYQEMWQQYWSKCVDVYAGLNTFGQKQKYLPRWAGEKKTPQGDPYADRVEMTIFNNRFAPTINSHSGLLSGMTVSDDLPEMKEFEDNIDMRGSSVRAFGLTIDQKFLRDSACIVIVDQKARPDVDTEADNPELRPYLTYYPLSQIIDWDVDYSSGNLQVSKFKVKRAYYDRGDDGTLQEREQYIIYEVGQVRVVDVLEDGTETPKTYPMTDFNGDPLEQIPFVWYSLFNSSPFQYCLESSSDDEVVYQEPPLFNLLKLNIDYFRKSSEKNMILHKANFPVAVLKNDAPEQDLMLGTSTYVQVPSNGDFYFREPSGASIGALQEELNSIKEDMDVAGQSFLSSSDNNVRTATEALLKSVQGRSILEAMRQIKESKWQEISEHWLRYTDPNYRQRIQDGYHAVSVDDSALRQAETVASLDRLESWFQVGLVSQEEAREQIRHSGVMYPEFAEDGSVNVLDAPINNRVVGDNDSLLDMLEEV